MKHMKHSIKIQFAIIFISLLAGTIGACLCINSVFLQKYYVKSKLKTVKASYDNLNQLFQDGELDSDEFDIEFTRLCTTNNLSVVVVDSALQTIKCSSREEDLLIMRLMDYIFNRDSLYPKGNHDEVLFSNDSYVVKMSNDPRMKSDYMELWGTLGNDKIIFMRTPLESIRESVSIANRFLTYVGFTAMLLCALIIWIVSTRITRPILELADISERMTNLDFDAKYRSGGKNEIGILGEHINQMSETLEYTISELKTANNELQSDLKKKEEIDEMRKEFLSNVSHELKTPIALIQGYAEGLKEGISDDAESRDFYCEVIMDEANKMNKLVKNLLNLNQLECGNDTITLERFDIVELILNCIQSSDILIKQANAEVIFGEKDPIYVWADEFKTEEVFTNYFSNAIHHVDGERKIEIKIENKQNIVRISVFNTGKPIAEDCLEQVWTKFYKVDKARTREYGGSGVGLSIVKAIMESFNKEYGVTNYENGVAFWFELDCK